jgi:(p)ppGpp synthase/HD superfamily hydrolase
MQPAITPEDVPALAGAPDVLADANLFLAEQTLYLRPEDRLFLRNAFLFAETAHRDQSRQSGEPYITHPLAVASILTQWKLDAQALAAALLHDVMEDSGVTKLELTEKFGKSVAELVEKLKNEAKVI